jgi:hypothetical protein
MPKFRFAAAMAAILTACAISSADAGRLIPVPAVAGSTAMGVTAVNNSNIITGVYETPDYVSHGFFGTLDGNYTTFDAGTFTVPLGINDQGLITGWNLAQDCSFTYPPVGCEFVRKLDSSIDIVTKDRSQIGGYAYGITTHARFVGEYWVARQTQGYDVFGYYGKGHKYVADVTLPFNTNHTSPRGINEAGTIIGHYIDLDAQRLRGFIVRGGVATAVDYPDPNADKHAIRRRERRGPYLRLLDKQPNHCGGAVLIRSCQRRLHVDRSSWRNLRLPCGPERCWARNARCRRRSVHLLLAKKDLPVRRRCDPCFGEMDSRETCRYSFGCVPT